MMPSSFELFGALCLGFAILHSFLVSRFQLWARRFPEGSVLENLFHLLGEIEVAFGLWASIFFAGMTFFIGETLAFRFLNNQDFREPLFVFTIMVVAATRPVLSIATRILLGFSRVIPLPRGLAQYIAILGIGPLLGSLITEPAAMAISALLTRDLLFRGQRSNRFKYLTLGTLFVNVSIGGALTHFAAPPIIMVATAWNWGTSELFHLLGWKALLAVITSATLSAAILSSELTQTDPTTSTQHPTPLWVSLFHVFFMAGIVYFSHQPVPMFGLFFFFLGFTTISEEFQSPLKFREALLVTFFLSSFIILGSQQRWWLSPLLSEMNNFTLFLGTIMLTAITDNALITYLGSQIQLVTPSKIALVSGAVAGGGLTVIANAPNPIGYSLLNEKFGENGISPVRLLLGALIPTLVSATLLWILPSLQ